MMCNVFDDDSFDQENLRILQNVQISFREDRKIELDLQPPQ